MFLFNFNDFMKDLWADLKDVWGSYKWVLCAAAGLIALFLLLFIIACVKSRKNKKAYKACKQQLEAQKTSSVEEPVIEESVTDDKELVDENVDAVDENDDVADLEAPIGEDEIPEEETPVQEVVEDAPVQEVIEDTLVEEAPVQEEVETQMSDVVEKAPVEENPSPVVEETPTSKPKAKKTTAKKAPSKKKAEEPKVEAKEETKAESSEPVSTQVAAEEPKVEEVKEARVTKRVASKKKVADPKNEERPFVDEVSTNDETPKAEAIKEEPAETKAPAAKTNSRIKGKYEIVSSSTGYIYTLKASNGESLIVSESYTTLKGCKTAIKRLQENSIDAELRIEEDKNKNFQFHVVKGTRIVAHSANYSTKASAVNASKSFMKFVNTDNIKVVESEDDQLELVDLSNAEISTETTGKIVIYNNDGVLVYKLIANNGQIICTSPTYKTMSALNGSIAKFQEAVYNGKFYILKDKNGNHQFKLYSSTNRLIMTGESFTSIDNAKSNVASCYRFAKNATIEVAETE